MLLNGGDAGMLTHNITGDLKQENNDLSQSAKQIESFLTPETAHDQNRTNQ